MASAKCSTGPRRANVWAAAAVSHESLVGILVVSPNCCGSHGWRRLGDSQETGRAWGEGGMSASASGRALGPRKPGFTCSPAPFCLTTWIDCFSVVFVRWPPESPGRAQRGDPGPAAAASPEGMFKMQVLRLHTQIRNYEGGGGAQHVGVTGSRDVCAP